jgi:hypothetical protein
MIDGKPVQPGDGVDVDQRWSGLGSSSAAGSISLTAQACSPSPEIASGRRKSPGK